MQLSAKPIQPTGASVFTRKIQAGRNLQSDLNQYAGEIKSTLQNYPAQQTGIRANFVSERQRRRVMAGIREGSIVVPYRRTRTLASGWQTVQAAVVSGSLTAYVYNLVRYAAAVHGRNLQRGPARRANDFRARGYQTAIAVAIRLRKKYRDRMTVRLRSL